MTSKRVVQIRGKPVTFSSRILKSGETAYYRSGKRVTTYYQTRLARGLLAGLTLPQARGHGSQDFAKNFASKALTHSQLATAHEGAGEVGQFALEEWGATFGSKSERAHAWYADFRVTTESMKKRGSEPDSEGEACQVATLRLVRRRGKGEIQQHFTKSDIRFNIRIILEDTLAYYRLVLCTGNLEGDLLGFWRHAK